MAEPLNPTKAYLIRLQALRSLEKQLQDVGVPTYMIFDFPQMASSFEGDLYQPLLLVGDLKATRDIRYLYSDTRDCWFFALDSWRNDRGSDTSQVAGELTLWWAEVLAGEITKRPDLRF